MTGASTFTPTIDAARRTAGRFWRVRAGEGPVARVLWSLLAILLAIPIAIIMVVFVVLLIGFAIAMILVGKIRRLFGGGGMPGSGRSADARDPDRENVRVVRRSVTGSPTD
jgi:hypothetical protein